MRAADPMFRFGLGGHRGAGGPAGGGEQQTESHLMQVQEDHMARVLAMLEDLHARTRLNRNRFYTEFMYAASAARAEPESVPQDQVRITYVYAEAGTVGGFLVLKGGQSGVSRQFTIPPNTQPALIIPIGDPDTGGIILERSDLRYVITKDGSSQLISCVLAGERLGDKYLS